MQENLKFYALFSEKLYKNDLWRSVRIIRLTIFVRFLSYVNIEILGIICLRKVSSNSLASLKLYKCRGLEEIHLWWFLMSSFWVNKQKESP